MDKIQVLGNGFFQLKSIVINKPRKKNLNISKLVNLCLIMIFFSIFNICYKKVKKSMSRLV